MLTPTCAQGVAASLSCDRNPSMFQANEKKWPSCAVKAGPARRLAWVLPRATCARFLTIAPVGCHAVTDSLRNYIMGVTGPCEWYGQKKPTCQWALSWTRAARWTERHSVTNLLRTVSRAELMQMLVRIQAPGPILCSHARGVRIQGMPLKAS